MPMAQKDASFPELKSETLCAKFTIGISKCNGSNIEPMLNERTEAPSGWEQMVPQRLEETPEDVVAAIAQLTLLQCANVRTMLCKQSHEVVTMNSDAADIQGEQP